ncbi:PKD domain-containing protein [Halorubrum sp. CSM-61]|uniref:PKD domain-containing protein n=1 Tax=Halorubrum sp. CSM-61 TaxID=2485838 RepID=UPI000F4BB934|nr:PKD domain-containing protein [Halorubrum sp. CSM-61]
MKRRDVVSGAGASVLGVATLGTATSVSAQTSSDVSISFDDQTTDGTRLTVAEISTDIDAQFRILDSESTTLAGPISFDAGTVHGEYEVDLQPPLTETETVTANLYDNDGQGIAREAARVTISGDPNLASGIEPTLIESDSDAGFNYPYFLYAPSRRENEQQASILVQPNNSGQTTDDFDVQRRSARRRIESGISRTVADRLSVPLLIPVLPRPESDPVDWRHYVHALDRQTMQISDGPLERVDRQLLRMADDARQRLSERSYPVDDQVMLNGFSAAGNFVDRFTVLHPDRVRSVTAGGLNGTAILPLEEADGHTLDFHIGIADVEALIGESVDLDALNETNQFLYMGEDDGNDTIPYDDAWSDSMREIALDVYGEAMVADRFPTCQRAYEQAGVDAQFKVYEGAGHSPRMALEDIVEFHQRSLDGDDVSGFGQRLGLRPAFEYTPDRPETGDEITFDASSSALGVGEVLAYTWQLTDEETAAGETITHQFTGPGEYAVTLRAIDDKGRIETTTTTIRVGENETDRSQESDNTSTDDREPNNATTDGAVSSEPTRGTTPGFGIGVAVTSIISTSQSILS